MGCESPQGSLLPGCLGRKIPSGAECPDSYWHGEGIRCFFQGSVTLDGVAYEVEPETSYGYADKHWGRSFNSPWFQFACGNLTSKRSHRQLRHSALAMNCLRPRFLRFSLRRRLVLQLTYMGEDFEFSRCKWDTKETSKRFVWHILAQNKKTVIKISGSCTKAEMQNLLYESPDGNLSRLPSWQDAAASGRFSSTGRTPAAGSCWILWQWTMLCAFTGQKRRRFTELSRYSHSSA